MIYEAPSTDGVYVRFQKGGTVMALSVLFQGKKTSMHVNAWGFRGTMLVQPGVATTELEMGIIVSLFDERNPNMHVKKLYWGLLYPDNLIAFWRGMHILQEVRDLGESDLCSAFYAGQRIPHDSEKPLINKIVAKIGRDTYDEIMARPIPDDVVDLIIKLADEGRINALWPITLEVEAGTLEWHDDFTRIGVEHPQLVASRRQAERVVINRYDSLIAEYARDHNMPRKCLFTSNIEEAIIKAVVKGVEDKYGKDVVLCFAISSAHAYSAAMETLILAGDKTDYDYWARLGVNKAVRWVVCHINNGWRKRRSRYTTSELENIILQLNDEWEKMPITHPLIP